MTPQHQPPALWLCDQLLGLKVRGKRVLKKISIECPLLNHSLLISKGCSSGCLSHTVMAKVGGCLSPRSKVGQILLQRYKPLRGCQVCAHVLQPHGACFMVYTSGASTSEELLATGGCWKRQGHSLLGTRSLVYCPRFSGWSHTTHIWITVIRVKRLSITKIGEVREMRGNCGGH